MLVRACEIRISLTLTIVWLGQHSKVRKTQMNDLDRIEHELQYGKLNHDEFERFAQDQLAAVYPGFIPVIGGTDWGRDGDIAARAGLVR